MLSCVYRLTDPGVFQEFQEEVNFLQDQVLVRPTHLSICHADQRYYQGLRPKEILKNRLPMALIHEAAGIILCDPKGAWEPGQKAVFIPNQLPDEKREREKIRREERIEENYQPEARFCGSSTDGFLQEILTLPRDRILPLPDKVPLEIGAFTEMISVAFHGIRRIKVEDIWEKRGMTLSISVWGDGNLAYLTGLLLKYLYPAVKLDIFGVNQEKLEYFTFADRTHHIDRMTGKEYEKSEEGFQIAFECVGGEASGIVIEEIVKKINPEGRIALLGVSEYAVPIDTRRILEKGLTLTGNSRSGREDFENVIRLYEKQEGIIEALLPLVGEIRSVSSVKELSKAFERDENRRWGKTILVKSSGVLENRM